MQNQNQKTKSEELETISMVTCPYCERQWVREDMELVCEKCTPALECDLAVADLVSAADKLADMVPDRLLTRIDLIISTAQKLTQLIKKTKPKP